MILNIFLGRFQSLERNLSSAPFPTRIIHRKGKTIP
jgi:hypothetical protein